MRAAWPCRPGARSQDRPSGCELRATSVRAGPNPFFARSASLSSMSVFVVRPAVATARVVEQVRVVIARVAGAVWRVHGQVHGAAVAVGELPGQTRGRVRAAGRHSARTGVPPRTPARRAHPSFAPRVRRRSRAAGGRAPSRRPLPWSMAGGSRRVRRRACACSRTSRRSAHRPPAPRPGTPKPPWTSGRRRDSRASRTGGRWPRAPPSPVRTSSTPHALPPTALRWRRPAGAEGTRTGAPHSRGPGGKAVTPSPWRTVLAQRGHDLAKTSRKCALRLPSASSRSVHALRSGARSWLHRVGVRDRMRRVHQSQGSDATRPTIPRRLLHFCAK